MAKDQIHVCSVFTTEFPSGMKEQIKRSLFEAGYRLHDFQSIGEFQNWYSDYQTEVCLLLNEEVDSAEYDSLKGEFAELDDFIFVDAQNAGRKEWSGTPVLIDKKTNELDVDMLIEEIKAIIPIDENEMSLEDENELGVEEDESDAFDSFTEGAPSYSQELNDEPYIGEEPPLSEEEMEDIARESQEQELNEIQQIDDAPADSKAEEVEAVVEHSPSASENASYSKRLRSIQKSLTGPQMDEFKTIGVWSPLPAMGVTSFILNFSFFLAENRIHTAVLESLTSNHILKDWLLRYGSVPDKWVSLAENLHADQAIGNSEWVYRGVKFFPLNTKDGKHHWNPDSFDAFYRMTGIYDVTLIDIPTGEMAAFTKESLRYLDELWILVDDRVQQLNSWKGYIKGIKESSGLDVHLIHNKSISASKPGIISEGLGSNLLAEMPPLWEETARNYYQNQPLYFQAGVREKVQKPYHQLARHLIGPSFQLQEKKANWWEQLTKSKGFQKILNG
ncbi:MULTISPECIES: hypothetical protein [unclassified Planococcus (in: firmicutes)]|uniref:hypothetical protein n=1 Tax=unclassified Planococcus (in: firmicutes) TaxID=2662419 RepID=UPI000C3343A8|nr:MULTISPECIES: hypothetical protein [unclassified Planococcus (in: firmicutes)]AUD12322.1 hypothetical protein CW734_00130 [Planococcus sp. MB-3u-03]PKG46594.1 hypothetical protein CXF66_06885 [Planococcus sp. Urea-trap-24]PKG89720.1 hypothetical protein CXF91_05920 [Planococcus sp. Urea-3u-39]PKH40877.1 hypothetical protein CXF77_07475 [Planococcus sp. MB-3u-09]